MSRFYFINQQGAQVGPVEKESLLSYGVTRSTMVWTEGMPNWAPAEQVPELAELFQPVQPVYPNPTPGGYPYGQQPYNPAPGPQPGYMQKPQSYLWLAILTTILCCLPAGIVSIVYASKVDSNWAMGQYEQAKSNSDKAKMWGIISAVAAAVVVIAYVAFFGVLFEAARY